MMSDISLEHKQQQFRGKLEKKVAAIPDDKKVLPKPNILGPSIQALEYGIFEDEIAEMFANLIASSMDLRDEKLVHPAFVEIIKQMTPDEAKLISYISRVGDGNPLVSLHRITKTSPDILGNSVEVLLRRFSLVGTLADCKHPELTEQMLDNLERLKLIEIELSGMGGELSEKNLYDPLIERIQEDMSIEISQSSSPSQVGDYRISRGYFEITAFGKSFVRVCLKENKE